MTTVHVATDVIVRPLRRDDLDDADRVCRIAFGTFLGAPEPERCFGDADVVRSRWATNPGGAVAAVLDGELIGSSLAASWGSVGVLGPVSVSPAHWDRAVGKLLMDATMEVFAGWGTAHVGLMTFANSPKHVGLYQRYGFWPRSLTALMARPVAGVTGPAATRLSELGDAERTGALDALRECTDAVHPGLDLTTEIESIRIQRLGDTVILGDDAGVQAMAVCHIGAGSEAGSGSCYVKFGAVRPGPDAQRHFGALLDACDLLAAARGASTLTAGTNAARERAWRALRAHGFRVGMQAVAMHRPNEPAYSTRDSFVIDDWR